MLLAIVPMMPIVATAVPAPLPSDPTVANTCSISVLGLLLPLVYHGVIKAAMEASKGAHVPPTCKGGEEEDRGGCQPPPTPKALEEVSRIGVIVASNDLTMFVVFDRASIATAAATVSAR